MKSPYSKFVKYLEKREEVYFQYCDNMIYLTDSFIAIRVPEYEYDTWIRPLSGMFPDRGNLPDGAKGKKGKTDFTIVIGNGVDIKGIYNLCADSDVELKKTPFLVECKVEKKTAYVRILVSEVGAPVSVNDNYLEMFPDYNKWRSKGKRNDLIVCGNDQLMCLICPIKLKEKIWDTWGKVNPVVTK